MSVSIVWVSVGTESRPPDTAGVDRVLSESAATNHVEALDRLETTCFVAAEGAGLDWFEECARAVERLPPSLLVVDDQETADAAMECGPVDDVIWWEGVHDADRFELRARHTVEHWADAGHPTVTDFEPLVERTQDLLTVIDQGGRIRYANPVVEDILGYDRDEFVGSPAFEYVHPDDRAEVAAETESVLDATETVTTTVYRARHADGSWRWLESVSQSEDLTAPVDGYVVCSRDVTERVERERRLRHERETTENVLESLEDAYFVVDTDGRLRRWNSTVEEALGLDPERLDGLDVRTVFVDEHQSRLATEMAAVMEGESRTVRLDVVDGDGERRPYEYTTSPFVVDGEIEGICGIGRDVSEREVRAEQRRRSERRFQAVFDDPMAFLGILDTDGRMLEMNEHAREFIGVTADEVTGERFWDLSCWSHSQAERDRARAAVARVANGEFVRFKTTNVGENGEIVHLDTSLRPVTRDDGSVGSIVAEGIDIGEEVKATRERELLLDAIQSAARSPDLEAALTETLRTVVTGTNTVYGEAWVPTDDDELQLSDAWWTADPDLEPFGTDSEEFRVARGEDLAGRVWASAEPEWLLDLSGSTTDEFARLDQATAHGVESAIGVPVRDTDDSVLTVLVFLSDVSQNRDERFLELLTTITAHLGAILQRKLVEDQLAAERERQQRLLETSPVGILVVGSDGHLKQENQRARDILGVEPGGSVAAAYERDPWRLTPTSDDAPELTDGWFQEVSETGQSIRNEVYVVHRGDGERLWLLVNAAAVASEEDSEVIVSFSDITEQKRHEQAFQNQAERVSVLNRVLRHDLRTHLTVVAGLLDRIVARTDAPKTEVEEIRQSLDDLETLSHRARRIEAAFESEEQTTVDLGALVERAVVDAEECYPAASFAVRQESVSPVLVHEHIRLAVDNLLENAVVHHDGDDPSVEVAVERRDEAAVRLVVSDDGPGIPHSEIELREERLETALEHSDGLGLWIVRWLVSKSDGDLSLERTGNGSRAVVTLPVAPVTE